MPEQLITAIVDDHPIVIEGLKVLLEHEPNMQIVGGFSTGTEMLSYIASNPVNLILLDIGLPDINGMDLCRAIKEISISTIILIFSNRTERSIIMQAIQNGASGYLLKNSSLDELRQCITDAMQGKLAYSKEVNEIISRPSRNELQGVARLTKREQQILKMIAEGKTTVNIAGELFLSPLTVETHRKNLLQKLGTKNVAELIAAAHQQVLL